MLLYQTLHWQWLCCCAWAYTYNISRPNMLWAMHTTRTSRYAPVAVSDSSSPPTVSQLVLATLSFWSTVRSHCNHCTETEPLFRRAVQCSALQWLEGLTYVYVRTYRVGVVNR